MQTTVQQVTAIKNAVVTSPTNTNFSQQIAALEASQCNDPFAFLGPHKLSSSEYQLRAFLPGAEQVFYINQKDKLAYQRVANSSLFILNIAASKYALDYQQQIHYPQLICTIQDPYKFPSTLDLVAAYLFNEGNLAQAQRHLGAHQMTSLNSQGVRFCVWAPNAKQVSVIASFNHWDARKHPMRKHLASGIWEIFIPEIDQLLANEDKDYCYKYSILSEHNQHIEKADPYAQAMQLPPATCSLFSFDSKLDTTNHQTDAPVAWSNRAIRNAVDQPISIYEVHAGSWRRNDGNQYLSYKELAQQLVPYVKDLGFTHIQLMPISEFPFDGSWGYQPIGLFAPSSRFGTVKDFQYFVDACHQADIGLLIDWVPGHFPSDEHGLAQFDGSHLYEHADSRQGFHPDWKTHIFNYDRAEVKSYLLSSAMAWFDNFTIDGLRVDAVASMLYLDYSREQGEWIPNHEGGRENFGAIELLRQVNKSCYQHHPGIMMVAEESTAWPGVTQFTDHGGLGFGYKWNMGWMNDSLKYMSLDPIHRSHHHHDMTFSIAYAWSENFILPLSHDEVVHGKGSLLNKMPGDDWQKFANLRAYYAFMWAHPGKKLLFMGGEFAQHNEWNHDQSLDWHLLEHAPHAGMQQLLRELNQTYKATPALYQLDNSSEGFQWIDVESRQQSIFSFIRFAKQANSVVVVSNMTPETYQDYRIGAPRDGLYQLILNTDNPQFYGSNFPVQEQYQSEPIAWQGQPYSINISIPPLATLYLLALSD